MKFSWKTLFCLIVVWTAVLLALHGCGNNPWKSGAASENTLFTTISAEIRNLDPSAVNYTHESAVLDNIVEPPLAYHYLKRPYELIPQLLEELPVEYCYDANGELLGDNESSEPTRTEYLLHLKPGIRYQPHPAFAPSEEVHALVAKPKRPQEFGPTSARAVTAEDLHVSLVRLCDPRSNCTVFSQLAGFLDGLSACRQAVSDEIARMDAARLAAGESLSEIAQFPSLPDYRKIPCAAIEVLDEHTLRYRLTRKYPQFRYWLTMHYFAPIPYEALAFYARRDVASCGLKFADWPVGCGPFMLQEYDPAFRIILSKNPNYRDCRYPSEGNPGDAENGLLDDAGRKLPFLDQVVFNWEPESLPAWTKFQQGYYDNSGVPSDMFDKALSLGGAGGELALSTEMQARGMRMVAAVPPISYYFAFNMRDPVVGGLGERQRLLRQAISIAMDTRQSIAIFRNGNGIASEGIIPPGIFGAAEPPKTMNNVVNRWDGKDSVRRPIEEARALLAQAGYPGGIDRDTGEQLVLHLDHAAAGQPDFKNRFRWLADRIALLGIRLEERGTDLNRSRQRVSEGNWQFLYGRGWVADYPDPENFLMLYASENGQVEHHGPNYANYASPQFDALFRKLETMENTPERLELIEQANQVLYRDAPVVWDFHPKNISLTHAWLYNYLPQSIAYDNLKYLRVDPHLRTQCQKAWNRPRKWPILLPLLLGSLFAFRRRRSA